MMTIEEKFRKGIVVYKNEENDYVCELWGASTKHPDSIFHMNSDGKYKKSGLYDDDKYEVWTNIAQYSAFGGAFNLDDYSEDNYKAYLELVKDISDYE